MLNEFSLPENILKHIYNFTYRCYDCEQDEEKEEKMECVITQSDLSECNMEKMILSIEHTFPSYDIVKTIIPGIKSRRYNKLQRIFDEIMPCKDKEHMKNFISHHLPDNNHSVRAVVREFNKVIRRCFNEPDFDILD